MNRRAAPRWPCVATDGNGTRNRLDLVAAAEAGDEGMSEGGILEIEPSASLTIPVVPAGALAHPLAPQVSSSQACMISSWWPNPSGGTAIRTRTGYRRSASRWARIDARIMRHLPSFMLRSKGLYLSKKSCREVRYVYRLAARFCTANIKDKRFGRGR